MSIWTYLRGHVLSTCVGMLLLAMLGAMLCLVGLGAQLVAFIVLCVALALVCMGLANYLRTRGWYRRFAEIAGERTDALGLLDDFPEPDVPEGQVAHEALMNVARQANARAAEWRQREREHREFVETWVHEIKTPLAAVDLMLDNLNDPRLAPLAHELARVGAYVEQALYFARSSSVENDYLVRSCSMETLVRETVKSRARALIGAHVAVGMEGLGHTVFADAKWMEFVLGQLIDNAIRYRRDEGARIDFTGRLLDEGKANERVVLSVRDNGCGISAADVGRVFDKGFTGENGRTRAKSTGIGLYLVRNLCEKMGLSVGVSSIVGEWTCFDIVFPTNRMHVLGE